MKKSVIVIIAVCALPFLFGVKQSFSSEPKKDLRNETVMERLDSYRINGALSTHFVCDDGNVSVKRYSTVNYTLLVIENKIQKNVLFSFSNDEEALAGGSIGEVRQYFNSFDSGDGRSTTQIKVNEFMKLLETISPNFYKFVAVTQHKPYDTGNDSLFKNDCRAIRVGED